MLLSILLLACTPDRRGPFVPVVTDGSTALDVNDDGYADLVLSKRDGGSPEPRDGLYVLLGGPEGFDVDAPLFVDMSLSTLDVRSDGLYVDWAGDLDDDGLADVVVTELVPDETADAFVYYGSPDGLRPEPTVLPGTGAYGATAGRAGDFDGDGVDDLFVFRALDEIAIHLGGAGGVAAEPAFRYDVEAMPADFVLPDDHVSPEEDHLVTVGRAGDIDGDGRDDLLVRFEYRTGDALYALHGGGAWELQPPVLGELLAAGIANPGLGDFDGNGVEDLVFHGSPDPEQLGLQVLFGSEAGITGSQTVVMHTGTEEIFDGRFVAPIGDVDADGYGDVALQKLLGGQFTQILRGGPEGLEAEPSQGLAVPAEDLQRYQNEDLANYGVHAWPLGDVDGDGFGDAGFLGNTNGVGGDTLLVEYGGPDGLDGARYQHVYLQSVIHLPRE